MLIYKIISKITLGNLVFASLIISLERSLIPMGCFKNVKLSMVKQLSLSDKFNCS